MDGATSEKKRLDFAKVCVTIPLDFDFPASVKLKLGSKHVFLDVEYPWKPPSCTICCRFGHATNKCPASPPQVWVPRGRNARAQERTVSATAATPAAAAVSASNSEISPAAATDCLVAAPSTANVNVASASIRPAPQLASSEFTEAGHGDTNGPAERHQQRVTPLNQLPNSREINIYEGLVVGNEDVDDDLSESESELFGDTYIGAPTLALPKSTSKYAAPSENQWTTVKPKRSKRIQERSSGEIEPTLAMMKKVKSLTKNKKMRHLEDYTKEFWDDTLGLTYVCCACEGFFCNYEKAQTHLRKDHPKIVKEIMTRKQDS